jgi:flagellar motility protein MotE (MotC chaperone)
LQERRQELDSRDREIELRRGLLEAAEKKFDAHANELRDLESNANATAQKKEEAEAQRLKNLITMYENMKAKDAARIFDRLEMRILVEVASQINPRRMSDILGQMSSEAAERLTVELVNRASAGSDHGADAGNLPKIEGTPRN